MRETKFYERLKVRFDKWGETDRVENSLGSGMSDVYYNFGGVCGWIETKVAKGDNIYFEKFQPNWMRRHVRQGATRMFVMVIDEYETIYVFRSADIVDSMFTPYKKWLLLGLHQCPPSLVMQKPYSNFQWGQMHDLLIS